MAIKKTLTERMAEVVLLTLGSKVEALPCYDDDGNEEWELFSECGDEMFPVTMEEFPDEDAAWAAWCEGVNYIKSKVNGVNGKENENV